MDSLLSPPSPVASSSVSSFGSLGNGSLSNKDSFGSLGNGSLSNKDSLSNSLSIPSYDDVVAPRLEAAIASRGLDLVDVTVPVQCLVEDNSRWVGFALDCTYSYL